MKTLTVKQGQAQFPALCRKAKTSVITQNGKVIAYIMPQKWMDGLLQRLETMENMADSEAMTTIKRAKAKKTVDRR
jgi:hypothetical protein